MIRLTERKEEALTNANVKIVLIGETNPAFCDGLS